MTKTENLVVITLDNINSILSNTNDNNTDLEGKFATLSFYLYSSLYRTQLFYPSTITMLLNIHAGFPAKHNFYLFKKK